jgi:transposase
MKKTAVYKWVTRFSEGRECVTDEERLGRPATSRTEKKKKKLQKFAKFCLNIVG